MKKTAKLEYEKIDYDKLNAYNMQNPSLGEAYLNFQWDPLGPDFKLDLPYIEKYLENARDKSEIKIPDFIEKSPKEVKEAFKNALKNNISLRTEIQSKYDIGEYASYKNTNIEAQVKDILFFLNCREQMLQIAIGKIKANGINTANAYKNIYSLNKKISALLEETYRKEYNQKVALNNMLLQAQLEKLNHKSFVNSIVKEALSPLQEPIGTKMMDAANNTMGFLRGLAKGLHAGVGAVIDMFK